MRELGQAIAHVGTNGQSLLLKLAVNISLAVQTLPFGEGVLLAERGRIDPQLAAEVMSTSSIGSPMLKARVPHPRPTQQAWFDVTLMEKDIQLARKAANELQPTSSKSSSRQLPSQTRYSPGQAELGCARRDLAARHEVLATCG